MKEEITDLTRGVYRRLYAGFLRGRRINSVSLTAEAWFWRLHAVADDFGNLDGEPVLCHAATAGRRASEVPAGKVAAMVGELVKVDLLRRYAVDGEEFLHIVGFNERQPAGKNGKRVRRVPASPWDDEGESGGIRVNPDSSSASDSDSHSDTDTEDNPAAQGSAEPGKRASAAADPTPVLEAFLEFPTVAGRRDKSATWALTESYVSELSETFGGIDVRAECRKALAWVRAKPANRKTAGGMREFIFRWMSRAQDRGGVQSNNGGGYANGESPDAYAARLSRT